MSDEMRDHAAPYAMGALDGEELAAFEAHLATGCAACGDEVRLHRATAESLAQLATPVRPPKRLREQLLERIEDDDAIEAVLRSLPDLKVPDGVHVVRADDGRWVSAGVPGITLKRLYQDRAAGTTTMLVRMAAGSRYPAHRHHQIEQALVLEGEMHVGDDVVLRAGDFQLATPSSDHAMQWTETGCTILLVASEQVDLIG